MGNAIVTILKVYGQGAAILNGGVALPRVAFQWIQSLLPDGLQENNQVLLVTLADRDNPRYVSEVMALWFVGNTVFVGKADRVLEI